MRAIQGNKGWKGCCGGERSCRRAMQGAGLGYWCGGGFVCSPTHWCMQLWIPALPLRALEGNILKTKIERVPMSRMHDTSPVLCSHRYTMGHTPISTYSGTYTRSCECCAHALWSTCITVVSYIHCCVQHRATHTCARELWYTHSLLSLVF